MLMVGLCGCSPDPEKRNPATGEEDRRLGAEQHPQLLAEFGGSYSGPQANYVSRLGERLAVEAKLPGQCTFTLVNSDVVNAFAVPGCYIYVTRGLLSIVNSEAELASVLAHELGHIVANHSGRQQRRSLWRQLGVLAVSVVTGSETLTRLAGQAAGLFTLRYSRKQEYESDDLAIRYLQRAGYDPYEAADMLAALSRHERFLASTRGTDEAQSMPEWTRTHPLTENRIERAHAAAVSTGVSDNALPEQAARYYSAVDELLYGDDPQQGFVIGRRFAHPIMRIGFEAPSGFTLTNSPQSILLEGPGGMRGEFAGGKLPPGDLKAYVEALISRTVGETPASIGAPEEGSANGVPMLTVPVLVQTREGQVQLLYAAYSPGGGAAYHFMLASEAGGTSASSEQLFRSFRILTAEEARSLRPRRIDVITASASDNLRTLSARMVSEHRLEHLLMLNGRSRDRAVKPGERFKVIVH